MEKTMRKTMNNCGVDGLMGELDKIMTKDYIPPCEHINFITQDK